MIWVFSDDKEQEKPEKKGIFQPREEEKNETVLAKDLSFLGDL